MVELGHQSGKRNPQCGPRSQEGEAGRDKRAVTAKGRAGAQFRATRKKRGGGRFGKSGSLRPGDAGKAGHRLRRRSHASSGGKFPPLERGNPQAPAQASGRDRGGAGAGPVLPLLPRRPRALQRAHRSAFPRVATSCGTSASRAAPPASSSPGCRQPARPPAPSWRPAAPAWW